MARRINWEEQLRRALEGPQTEPPISPRRPTQEPRTSSERPFLAPTTPSYIPQSLPRQPRVAEQDQGFPVELPGLTTSIQSYERASQLDENVGQRLRMVGKQIELHPVRLQGKIISQQVEEARALLRTPTSLRTLIMASVILGPPKGLGN